MALEARLIDLRSEGGCFSFAAEYYDTADPETVLFRSPRWSQPADADEKDIEVLIVEYGRTTDAAQEAPIAFADRTFEVIPNYSPSPERVEAVKAEIAALAEAAAAQDEPAEPEAAVEPTLSEA
jgi:hypothetical protein